jgi:hypothetical protein
MSTLFPFAENGYALDIDRIRVASLEKIEDALQELAAQEDTLEFAAEKLPELARPVLYNLLEVARLDVPTEKKLAALVDASGSNCSIYAIVWLVGLLISFIPYISVVAGALEAIGLLALILCLLGVI